MRATFVHSHKVQSLRTSKYTTPHATAASSTEAVFKRDLSELMEVLDTDSPNLFSEQGMHL